MSVTDITDRLPVLRVPTDGIQVEELPEYELVQIYLIGVTTEQLAEALRTTTLQLKSEFGAHVIKRKPSPPEAA